MLPPGCLGLNAMQWILTAAMLMHVEQLVDIFCMQGRGVIDQLVKSLNTNDLIDRNATAARKGTVGGEAYPYIVRALHDSKPSAHCELTCLSRPPHVADMMLPYNPCLAP